MIKIEILEKDIEECLSHLDFINKTNSLTEECRMLLLENGQILNNHVDLEIDNIHPIITIAQLEISLTLKSIHYSNHEKEKIHIIKRGLLIVYETIITLNNFNKLLKKYSNENEEMKNEYKEINNILKQYRKRIDQNNRIKEIRNKTAAHISSNFLEYYNNLEKINIEEDLHLIIAFRLTINELNYFVYKCLSLSIKNKIK